MSCSIPECGQPPRARGWCSTHYQRWRQHGDPLTTTAGPGAGVLERAHLAAEELAAGERACKSCGQVKPLQEYAPSSTNRAGRQVSCRPCRKAYLAQQHQRRKNTDQQRHSRRWRDAYLRRTYGLSIDQYDALATAQGGRCATCGRPADLVVDHCHDSGRRRELICNDCNLALGHVRDDPAVLLALVAYLERHSVAAG